MAFSLIMTATLANFVLIVKIYYGDMVITHNTMRPYYMAFFLLTICMLEISIWLLIQNVLYTKNSWSAISEEIYHIYIFQVAVYLPSNLKFALVIQYMMARIYDSFTLNFFIRFQKTQTLQSIDLVKGEFQKLEAVHAKVFGVICIV